MSILSIIPSIIGQVGKFLGGGGGGVAAALGGGTAGKVVSTLVNLGTGAAGGYIGTQLAQPNPGTMRFAPGPRSLPGGARLPALPGAGGYYPHRRKRGRGFSARDIRQQRRLMKMLKDFDRMRPHARATSRTACK